MIICSVDELEKIFSESYPKYFSKVKVNVNSHIRREWLLNNMDFVDLYGEVRKIKFRNLGDGVWEATVIKTGSEI